MFHMSQGSVPYRSKKKNPDAGLVPVDSRKRGPKHLMELNPNKFYLLRLSLKAFSCPHEKGVLS